MKRYLITVVVLLLMASTALAEKWKFVAIADNRSGFSQYRRVLEKIKDLKHKDSSAGVDFVLACGDISPIDKNHEIYTSIFKGDMTFYFPVRGNHEEPDDLNFISKNILASYGAKVKAIGRNGMSYYTDWKEVRLIVLDQFSAAGKTFRDTQFLQQLEDIITSRKGVRHVFVAFHEPYLPLDPRQDPFWSVLLRHKDVVRAVFWGHDHIYRRGIFPDKTGVNWIDVGNSGWVSHSDYRQTIVEISVDGDKISFRAIQAPDGSADFKATDLWEIPVSVRSRQSLNPHANAASGRLTY